MEVLETSGKNVDEAITAALQQLGLSRSEVEIEVVHEARRSILGIGGEDAVVRVTPIALSQPIEDKSDNDIEPEMATDTACQILEQLLKLMDVEASIEVVTSDGGKTPTTMEIDTPNPGVLIGRRGQALSALQYMTNFLASRQLKSGVKVMVDVADYRKRRQEELENMAIKIAETVKTNRRSVTLEPMGAWERRIIHLILREESGITTGSVGYGERRKVVVSPK